MWTIALGTWLIINLTNPLPIFLTNLIGFVIPACYWSQPEDNLDVVFAAHFSLQQWLTCTICFWTSNSQGCHGHDLAECSGPWYHLRPVVISLNTYLHFTSVYLWFRLVKEEKVCHVVGGDEVCLLTGLVSHAQQLVLKSISSWAEDKLAEVKIVEL